MKKWYDVIKENVEIGKLDDPQWDKMRRVHEWRRYIPQVLRENWKALTAEARIAVYLMAEEQANNEDWD